MRKLRAISFKSRITKKFLRRFMLLLLAVLVLFAVRRATAEWLTLPFPKLFQDFITLSLSIIVEALPFVILGIAISMAVQIWVPGDWFVKYLPKNPVLRRASISLLGVFLPVCECGNVPLSRTLIMKGLAPNEALVFLLAAPILNPVTIITTQQAFGSDPAAVFSRIAGGFLIANIVGWVFARTKREEMLQPDFIATCQVQKKHKSKSKLRTALNMFRQESRAMLPALLIGAAVAGLVQVLVPREVLLTLGSNPALSILAMLVLAFAVSICSSVDAFFALAFKNTFTIGSLTSFLTLGPMIDIKMLSLMRTTFRAKILWQVSGLAMVMAALLGLAVNYAL